MLNKKKKKHQYLIGDFDNSNNIKFAIENHINNANQYHILINNSGGPIGGPIVKADSSEFVNAFNRHLICNHILFQALYQGMQQLNFGRVINVISTSVKQPIAGLGVSNTVRGAVASWSKTLSFEVAKHGITVNNILPGFTDTERLGSLIESKATTNKVSVEAIKKDMINTVPNARFGKPEETAKAIAFLASRAAGYINGINLAVDGGRLTSL